MKVRKQRTENWESDFNRRDFLRGASVATLASLMGGIPLVAPAAEPTPEEKKAKKPPVNCGVIGLGVQGREILKALGQIPYAPVVAVCDTYEKAVKRALEATSGAEGYTDYKKLLDNKSVKAVLIATPTHQHREIVEAALAAGKHVYCEAPLAHTIEDARAIAQAAQKNRRFNFQAGLQRRADSQHHFLLTFIRSGALGSTVKARAQWARKTSWRRSAPTEEREKELNWRMFNDTSLGLVGEIGIHQLDVVCWMLKARPVSVTGFGGIQFYRDDGRETFDTVQAVFEFPRKVNFFYEATLANSFENEYEALYGSDAAVVLRGANAWMFKESDAPLLGWEVYARKDEGVAYKEAGIALRADATKIKAQGKQAEERPYQETALLQSMEAFIGNTNTLSAAMEDYEMMGGDFKDEKALAEYLEGPALKKARLHAAGWEEGYEATVNVIKANEAIVKRSKITFADEWFKV